MKTCYIISRAVGARLRCIAAGNSEWQSKWEAKIADALESFPSGSGFDNGTTLDLETSTAERLVFQTAFHHMNDGGFYDGWTEHEAIVTPSLELGFRVKITGRDRNEIKGYIGETFQECLDAENDEYAFEQSQANQLSGIAG